MAAAPKIPVQTNLMLCGLAIALHVFAFIFVPLYGLPRSSLYGLGLLPIAFLSNSFWALIHEAVHAHLHPRREVNFILGRLLSLLFGAPFCVLRFAHLAHHKNNGTLADRPDLYDPGQHSYRAYALGYYLQLFVGLYLFEVGSAFLLLLPAPMGKRVIARFVGGRGEPSLTYCAQAQARLFPSDMRLRFHNRLEAAAQLGLWIYLICTYGGNGYWLILLFALRGFLISFLDNSFHYGGPMHLYSGYNARLPKILSAGLLNFNLHEVHHRHPSLPWNALPQALANGHHTLDDPLWKLLLRQLGGPIETARLRANND